MNFQYFPQWRNIKGSLGDVERYIVPRLEYTLNLYQPNVKVIKPHHQINTFRKLKLPELILPYSLNFNDILEWCDSAEIIIIWYWQYAFFTSEQDAMLFRLKWL